jgi:GNAT superfamily N-acetyltransferase
MHIKEVQMNRPNLFSFATSELSQDAFVCWLLSWSAPEYKEIDSKLNQCAIQLIQALFKKHEKEAPKIISNVEVSKQDSNIDILCIVNDSYVILIEDKIGTKNHSDQLARYLKEVKNRVYKDEYILPIYYKTEDQGDYSEIINAGYQTFLRDDILQILNEYNGENSIILDYREHLQSVSDNVASYQSLPIDKWNWYSWIGFYLRLQRELGDGNWDYVPNPSGGFLGYWWHFQGDEECEQYLQLEEDKLCFKVWVSESHRRRELRTKWHERIKEKARKNGIPVKKPSRFGNGQYMTVCIYEGDYRKTNGDNVIDITSTVKLLKKAESLLESVYESA